MDMVYGNRRAMRIEVCQKIQQLQDQIDRRHSRLLWISEKMQHEMRTGHTERVEAWSTVAESQENLILDCYSKISDLTQMLVALTVHTPCQKRP